MRRWLALVIVGCVGVWALPINAQEAAPPGNAPATRVEEGSSQPTAKPDESRPRLERWQQLRKRFEQAQVDRSNLKSTTWKVGDLTREALVYAPPKLDEHTKPPLVFVFHGHGGTAGFVVRQLPIHTLWPEAVVVYAQGLPTPVPALDPEGKRSGWQKYVGDQDDRDLKFFDAMFSSMKSDYHIDEQRVYSTGHSNGAFFTYALWAGRGDRLAAVAPIAGAAPARDFKNLKPKPVLHIAGEQDSIVKFSFQERTMEQIRQLNRCDADGRPAGEHCTEYTSKEGPPVVTYIHPGSHQVPNDAAEKIVAFFKRHPAK